MVRHLHESGSTSDLDFDLRPATRERIIQLEAQIERLQSLQKREMAKLDRMEYTNPIDSVTDDKGSGSTVGTQRGAMAPRRTLEEASSATKTLLNDVPKRPSKTRLYPWCRDCELDDITSISNLATIASGERSESSSMAPTKHHVFGSPSPIPVRHDVFSNPLLLEEARTYFGIEADHSTSQNPASMSDSSDKDKNGNGFPSSESKERYAVSSFGKLEKRMLSNLEGKTDGLSTASKQDINILQHPATELEIYDDFASSLKPSLSHTSSSRAQVMDTNSKAEPSLFDTSPFSNLQQSPLQLNCQPAIQSQVNKLHLPSAHPVAGPSMKHSSQVDETSLFDKFRESIREQRRVPRESLIAKALAMGNILKTPEAYTQPFCNFLTENPTVWHAVDYFETKLERAGFTKLSERKSWTTELKQGGKYYVQRNGSSLVAFTVGAAYQSGNGVAMIAGHVDALTARLKPVSAKKTAAGYLQLGVAPYAGGLNTTWWDRDLGIGGRVLVKESSGKITTKLVKLGWPIARIPTLAPHFGVGMLGQNNPETQAVPIIGLDNSDVDANSDGFRNLTLGAPGTFAATQPPKLVRAIAGELSIEDYSSIINWELELFDTQPAQTGGLDKEFIFAGRIDDKLCSWAAMEGLLASAAASSDTDGIVKLVGVFDDEEIGSLLRQGARGNFLPSVVERISEAFSKTGSSANILSQTYANSFLVSADVTHAVNPNFLASYLENHAPRLNVGLVVSADSNGHMTTDSVSTALLTRVAEKSGSKLQLFMIRNDSRSGGTVGPMLSSAMGVRAIDAGIPQLSMHSIRATTGALDPGLGVRIFKGFLDEFEAVDTEFE